MASFCWSDKDFTKKDIENLRIADADYMEERGLNGECPGEVGLSGSTKHRWMLLPPEEGQKQYVKCLKCKEYSHL